MNCQSLRRFSKDRTSLWASCCAALPSLLIAEGTQAAPIILEPTATLTIPDARFTHIEDIDIDGDTIIMGVRRFDYPDPFDIVVTDAAYLYRRNANGGWSLERKLFEEEWLSPEDNIVPLTLGMEDGLAAIHSLGSNLYVFERSGSDWAQRPAIGNVYGSNLEVDAGTIVGSDNPGCSNGATAFRSDASGTYREFAVYVGNEVYCDGERIPPHAEIHGTTVIAPQESEDPEFVPFTYVWEGFPPSVPTAIPDAGASSIEGDWIAVAGSRNRIIGTQFYERVGPGNWVHRQTLEMPDALYRIQSYWPAGDPSNIQMDDGFVLQSRKDEIEVLQRNDDDRYELVARLLDAYNANVSGRTVVASSGAVAKVFELPTDLSQPDLVQDDFEDLDASDWWPQTGSQFAIAATAASHVYRQSSLVGNALAIHSGEQSRHQSIQADVTPTQYAPDGTQRWFGLITRYQDQYNYYYVTTRSSNEIQIRRMRLGEYTVLASATLPVTLNRTYNLRLEAIGDRLRLYVDNRLLLEAEDSTHEQGRVGLIMYKTAAQYDNVLINRAPLVPIMADTFDIPYRQAWTEEGSGWAYLNYDNQTYEHTSLSDMARSITGVSATRDQIVEARIRALEFASGGVRWLGLITRYQDPQNYYYVTLRSDNTISLRKLLNNAIHILDTATLNVNVGTDYRVRLEAVGDRLRVYVNEKHVLEGVDATFARGRYGLAAYKTRARFDDFYAVQP